MKIISGKTFFLGKMMRLGLVQGFPGPGFFAAVSRPVPNRTVTGPGPSKIKQIGLKNPGPAKIKNRGTRPDGTGPDLKIQVPGNHGLVW